MDTINIDQLQAELGAFFRVNSKEIEAMVYNQESELFKHCRTITKVKGKFPALHSVITHVVQGFKAEWNEIGGLKIKVNPLEAYHQKVNFPIVPAEILPSWLAETYEEGTSLEDQSISRYIMNEELKPRVVSDVADLVITGVYDANDLTTFGKSMNGILKIIELGITSTDYPMYKIPLTALTDSNIVDQVTAFEKALPAKVKKLIKKIFMSTTNAERYRIRYEDLFGANTNFSDGKMMKTRLGNRAIVGIDEIPEGNDTIFATPDRNLLRLIDKFDAPTVTDIQKQDYKLKIFMEWWLGVGFWINQLVFVAIYPGSGSASASENQAGLNGGPGDYYNSGPESGSGSASGSSSSGSASSSSGSASGS